MIALPERSYITDQYGGRIGVVLNIMTYRKLLVILCKLEPDMLDAYELFDIENDFDLFDIKRNPNKPEDLDQFIGMWSDLTDEENALLDEVFQEGRRSFDRPDNDHDFS